MLDHIFVPLTLIAAIGAGLIAGVFFAFSTFVMRALNRLPANEAIAAMQSINVAVLCPPFLVVFMGTAAISVASGIVAWLRWETPRSAYVLAGGLLYVIGTFLV